jgi:hypothetical protein
VQQAEFKDHLVIEEIGERLWLVKEPLRFYSKKLARTLKVPAGTPTDLASIPRSLWVIFPKVGKQDRAAVLHDAGYEHLLTDTLGNPLEFHKKTIDGLFLEAMLADGVSPAHAKSMYWAVRLFGRMHKKKAVI